MNEKQKPKQQPNTALRYSGMAFQMAIIIGLGTFIGRKIDDNIQAEKPWFTILFAIIFLFIAFYLTLKDLMKP